MITIDNVTFSYTKTKQLLSAFSLSIQEGNIHGLLGKNGEGKSTVLKLIAGLIFPKAGSINALGFQPSKRQFDFLSDIYFLGEELPESSLTIQQYKKVYAPFYPKFNKEAFENYLQEFEIKDQTVALDKLSHGQRKKVYIAFALATQTRILLMDEPTNGLDIPSKAQFRKMVAAAIDESRCVIISTHQVRDLDNLIDSIIIMDEHEILLNENIARIEEKLAFKFNDKNSPCEGVLYSEESIRGSHQVCENIDHADTKLDIELLFNATIKNREVIKTIFQH